MKQKTTAARLSLLALIACLGGCVSGINGDFVEIPISSDIEGTTAEIDGQLYTLPANASLRRQSGSYIATLTAPGYPQASITLEQKLSGAGLVDIIVIGLPPMTPGSWTFSPEEIQYSFLEGKNTYTGPPDQGPEW